MSNGNDFNISKLSLLELPIYKVYIPYNSVINLVLSGNPVSSV